MKDAIPQTLPAERDFRLHLQSELSRRIRANPRYSLRAFARGLGVAPSYLSHLLRGQRAVTREALSRLGGRLGLSPEKLDAFGEFHFPAASAPAPASDGSLMRGVVLRQLTVDQFQVVSDWYHYAILELSTCQGFQSSPRWIAGRLGISVVEVNAAVERLTRLGMLEAKGKRWRPRASHTTVGHAFTHAAFRNLQRQILEGALRALEETPMEDRSQSSLTLAFDSRQLPEIQRRLARVRRELLALQAKIPARQRDQVYQLSLSAYPLVKKERRKS